MKKILLHRNSLYILSGFMIIAGLNHFFNPEFYLLMMPSFFIFKTEINWISCAVEVLLGFGMFFSKYRKFAGMMIVLLLFSFLIVHINHFFELPLFLPEKYSFLLIIRLLFQFVLIFWFWKLKDIQGGIHS